MCSKKVASPRGFFPRGFSFSVAIFYAGDCKDIPFNIQGYDEYYFDFAEKESEYFLGPDGIKRLVKKNKIRKNKLWLVHFMSARSLELAQKAGIQIAREELKKFNPRY